MLSRRAILKYSHTQTIDKPSLEIDDSTCLENKSLYRSGGLNPSLGVWQLGRAVTRLTANQENTGSNPVVAFGPIVEFGNTVRLGRTNLGSNPGWAICSHRR